MPLANAVAMMLKARDDLERSYTTARRPVFISYSHKDAQLASALSALLAHHRFPVWMDTRLEAGEHYPEVLEQKLTEAFAVIVIVSRHSARSGWVLWEAKIAATSGKLVTALAPGVEPANLRPPFNTLHMISLSDVAAIVAALRRLAKRPPGTATL